LVPSRMTENRFRRSASCLKVKQTLPLSLVVTPLVIRLLPFSTKMATANVLTLSLLVLSAITACRHGPPAVCGVSKFLPDQNPRLVISSKVAPNKPWRTSTEISSTIFSKHSTHGVLVAQKRKPIGQEEITEVDDYWDYRLGKYCSRKVIGDSEIAVK